MYAASITSQWQLTIPVQVRRELGITEPQRVLVEAQGDKIIVHRHPVLRELRGALSDYAKARKPLTRIQKDVVVSRAVVKDYQRDS